MMKTHLHSVFWTVLQLLIFVCFIHAAPAYATGSAGKVVLIMGGAWAQPIGEAARRLEKGDLIYQSDVIRTEKDSAIQVLFNDQTKFYLGADTEMSIDKFDEQSSADGKGFSTHILKGTFRFVSGLIAKKKPSAMEVHTSVGTIGVRGTNVVGDASTTSATIILVEPEDTARKTSIEVTNKYGSVLIDEPGYGTEIPDEFSPPSPPKRMRLETINNIMRSMQSIQRINIPRPRMP